MCLVQSTQETLWIFSVGSKLRIHSVLRSTWFGGFRSGLDQSGPALVYTQRNSSGQCDRSTEGPAPHKCLYTFSKSMSPSDAPYHCAESLCGLMLFGNGNTSQSRPDPDVTVLSPDVSGPVDSGDSVDLQCWVQTQNTQCFEEHKVWWFRSGLDQSGLL
ncbi:hypothetical protein WMY93_032072 [Mugilogobius chulae]|uniref:Ig-like domain-containing protein n=1 Tax=Mugilogobius chulae TaxID=88201 RepID=A0AAW0MGV4_9GOBI